MAAAAGSLPRRAASTASRLSTTAVTPTNDTLPSLSGFWSCFRAVSSSTPPPPPFPPATPFPRALVDTVFDELDVDRSGSLEIDELAQLLSRGGTSLLPAANAAHACVGAAARQRLARRGTGQQ